jgi:hypothetical protein
VSYCVITVGLALAMLFKPVLGLVAGLLAITGLVCYVTVPVAYEIDGDRLRVVTRLGSKDFGAISRCTRLSQRISRLTLRVFGNGGVFAGTGFYWNPIDGLFQAYVTTTAWSEWMMVETARRKVLLSPAEPDAFVAACDALVMSPAAV